MLSRLTKDSKLSAGKNNVQPLVGRCPNWNIYDFKLDSGYKPKNSEVNFSENPIDDDQKDLVIKKDGLGPLFQRLRKDKLL